MPLRSPGHGLLARYGVVVLHGLAGHGTSWQDLARTPWQHWYFRCRSGLPRTFRALPGDLRCRVIHERRPRLAPRRASSGDRISTGKSGDDTDRPSGPVRRAAKPVRTQHPLYWQRYPAPGYRRTCLPSDPGGRGTSAPATAQGHPSRTIPWSERLSCSSVPWSIMVSARSLPRSAKTAWAAKMCVASCCATVVTWQPWITMRLKYFPARNRSSGRSRRELEKEYD